MPVLEPHTEVDCDAVVATLIDTMQRAFIDDDPATHAQCARAVLLRVATLEAFLRGRSGDRAHSFVSAPTLDDHQPDEVPAVVR